MGPRSRRPTSADAYRTRAGQPARVPAGSLVPRETDVLTACLDLCAIHPRVGWAKRMNVGGVKFGQQWVKFGFKGCSDILGQMRDGRFLAIEVKKPGARTEATRLAAQVAFLQTVRAFGGVGVMVDTVESLRRVLDAA